MKIDILFNDIMELCNYLNPFSTDIRYPYTIDLDNTICKKSLDYTKIIKDFITKKIEGVVDDQ